MFNVTDELRKVLGVSSQHLGDPDMLRTVVKGKLIFLLHLSLA